MEMRDINQMPKEKLKKEDMILPIRAKGIKLTRNRVKILNQLSVEISGREEITVVLGFNGAGKSALLRVLTGLILPDSGELTYGGFDLQNEQIKNSQTLVLQKPIMLRRSVGDNVRYGFIRTQDRAALNSRFKELISQCQITDLVDRPARSVSIGEQQRVSLARALALDPKVIYLDEPTSSLDPVSVQVVEDVIKKESEGGRKVIWVTHSVEQARRLASDVIFIHAGRVVEHQRAAEFFRSPRTKIAQTFIEGATYYG